MSPAGGGAWSPERRVLTAGLIGLVTAAAFEGMAIPTVLPLLVAELGGLDLYGWAFSAFWLTTIIGITLGGADADRAGPARPLVIGVALFAAGMLVSGLAPNMGVVILGRAIQGFGAGATSAVVYAVIARGYPPETTPRMIAFTSSAWIVPGLLGPAVAGTVAETIGWRWVFLSVAPLVAVMGAALVPQLRHLAAVGPAAASSRSPVSRAFEAARLAIGSTLLLWGLTVAVPLAAVPLLAIGGWLTIAALRRLLPAGSLRLERGRASVPAVIFGITFAFLGAEAFVPLTVVEVRGGNAVMGGLALSASAVTWAAGSWVQARVAGTGRRRGLIGSGAALIAVGIAIAATVLLPATPVAVAAIGWAVAGLGMGIAYSTASLVILETSPPGEEGISSSAIQLMFVLGTALGAGTGGAVVALADAGVLNLGAALGIVFGLGAAFALLAASISRRTPATGVARPAQPLPAAAAAATITSH